MTLLTTMLQRPLDPGYAAAAERREAEGQPRATSLRAPRLIFAMVGLAALRGGRVARVERALQHGRQQGHRLVGPAGGSRRRRSGR